MKLLILILLCIVMTIDLSAQGITKHGQSTTTSAGFVNKNGKVSSGSELNKNGQVLGPASLTTKVAFSITQSSATSGGNITSDSGATITARGICYYTSPNPTTSNSKTTDGWGTGEYISSLVGLTHNTTYYVRAYAISSFGTTYGNELSFKTYTGSVTDIDDNNYYTVTIGNQLWMAENLKSTKYQNGDLIGTTIPLYKNISAEPAAKYQWAYNGDENNVAIYGRLYTWYAVTDNRNVCPIDWHVPTNAEWTALRDYLINNGYGYEGSGADIAKSLASTSGWNMSLGFPTGSSIDDQGSNNSSGFTGLPSGLRYPNGSFFPQGTSAYWWSTTVESANNAWFADIGIPFNYLEFWPNSKNLGLSVRCLKDSETPISLPTVSTTTISDITTSTALAGGNVTNDGGSALMARGVCWSTSTNPTISDNKTIDGTGTGAFSSSITGLNKNTIYYIRAYATNSVGTAYGNEIIFATRGDTGVVSDVDGNTYSTIEIGTQIWMAQNLRTTKYNDSTSISMVDDGFGWWYHNMGPCFCWYNNEEATYKNTYGALYSWDVTNLNVCPVGWHVPDDADWLILIDYLGGYKVAGAKLREASTLHWPSPNAGATNESGFSALPGGNIIGMEKIASWNYNGEEGYWWSSSGNNYGNPRFIQLDPNFNNVFINSTIEVDGFSIRCLKDYEKLISPIIFTHRISNITTITASCGGDVTNDGGAPVTARGVCWSTSANPTISDSKTTNGTGTGLFTSLLTGLIPNTTYYVRSYASNSLGVRYGNELIFKTFTGTVTDIDSNVYNTVTIGSQIWIAEDLRTTRYRNGDSIGTTTVLSGEMPKYQWGSLYTWFVVSDSRKICPSGFHVSNDDEWTTLTNYLTTNNYGYQGNGAYIAKSFASSYGWAEPKWTPFYKVGDVGNDQISNNSSGFSAYSAGFRFEGLISGGPFIERGFTGIWWSSTDYTNYKRLDIGDNYLFSDFTNNNHEGGAQGFSVRCIQGPEPTITLPKLNTTVISAFTQTTATSGGNITSDGGSQITARGVFWSTYSSPTITENRTIDGTGMGAFSSSLTGLNPHTTYYVRAYATNSVGTGYGNEVSFTTLDVNQVIDFDCNVYNSIVIGTQTWMVENLKTTRYRNGDLIGTTIPATLDISGESKPKYQWDVNGAHSFVSSYGRLYTWYAATDSRNVCPIGWHVPTDSEWYTLENFIDQTINNPNETGLRGTDAGGKLKDTKTAMWFAPNVGATNEYGFSALPGGIRVNSGNFQSLHSGGYWWSSTNYNTDSAWMRGLSYNYSYVIRNAFGPQYTGLSVRCLKDN